MNQLYAQVGYGDIKPVTTSGKWFTIFYIIGSVTILMTAVAYIQNILAELRRERMASGEV